MREIMGHVSKLFEFYGEQDDYLDEYLTAIFKHDINLTLACFRDLVDKIDDFVTTKGNKYAKIKEKAHWIGESKFQRNDRLRKS